MPGGWAPTQGHEASPVGDRLGAVVAAVARLRAGGWRDVAACVVGVSATTVIAAAALGVAVLLTPFAFYAEVLLAEIIP